MASRRQLNTLKYACLLIFISIIGCVTYLQYIAPRSSSSSSNKNTRRASPAAHHPPYTKEETIFFTTGKGDALKNEPRLREYIRDHIISPSGTTPNLEDPTGQKDVSQLGQSWAIDKTLGGRRNGFFLECGAHDGEHLSNTLFFELERNWTGLLIEADPSVQEKLMNKNRNAYVLPACLNASPLPGAVKFKVAGVLGGIVSQMGDWQKDGNWPEMIVSCFPFNSILASIGVSHIDYFSLDVELAELAILNTIDFQRIRIDVISLEYSRSSAELSLKQLADYVEFFNQTAVKYGRRYEVAFFLPKGSTSLNGQDVVFKLKL